MALGPSDVYSPANPGLAQVLGSGLGPLHIIQQEYARRYREQQAAARLKLQQEQADARNVVPLEANGWLPHNDELTAAVQAGYEKQKQIYADPNKSLFQKKAEAQQIASGLKQQADFSNELGKKRDEIVARLTRDKDFDPEAVTKAVNRFFYKEDESGAHVPKKLAELRDTRGLDIEGDAALLNRGNVLRRIIDKNAVEESQRLASAARPGGVGHAYQATSNGYEIENGRIKRNADGSPVIKNPQYWLDVITQDSRGRALLEHDAQQQREANDAAVGSDILSRMQQYAPLSQQQQQTVANTREPMPPEEWVRRNLAGRFKSSESNVETFSRPTRSSAAGGTKLKDGDAVATPTSDFHLSVGDNGGIVTETVPNPNKGGLNNFLTPTVQHTSNKAQPFDNHYPAVGVSFASKRKPYVPLSVNTSQVTVLGADGTPTKFNNGKANSLINLNATDRSFVLEVNGKRLGLSKAGTSADAYAEMRRMVDSLTPEQARKAVLKAVYQGGTTDKAGTSGDGGGGGAKIIGYKNVDGEQLGGEELAEARRTGQYLQPVYDKEERQIKVLTPATAQLDAQVARATPGYNPRQRTQQEATLIQMLEAKGGRVSDPYHTTPTAIPQQKADPLGFTPKAAAAPKTKTVGKNNALGF